MRATLLWVFINFIRLSPSIAASSFLFVDDINCIINEHQGDKMQALTALEKWQQASGEFRLDILLESLNELKRKDIVSGLQKQVARSRRCS